MDKTEEGWMHGVVPDFPDRDADKERGGVFSHVLGCAFSAKNVHTLSISMGVLAFLAPWRDDMWMWDLLGSTRWLFVLAAVLFVTGTIYNWRHPIGILGQALGVAFWVVQIKMLMDSQDYEWYFQSTDIQLGAYLACLSIILCIVAFLLGAYRRNDFDQ
ncbi:MAG: hypothetical protein LUQ09_05800 [Methanomassiliicoccales archaeon]|nr:hypothetical protein [Methanomassiliicoccales archaeon]